MQQGQKKRDLPNTQNKILNNPSFTICKKELCKLPLQVKINAFTRHGFITDLLVEFSTKARLASGLFSTKKKIKKITA